MTLDLITSVLSLKFIEKFDTSNCGLRGFRGCVRTIKTADLSTTLRSGRDDKFVGVLAATSATNLSSRPERTRISYLTAAGNDHGCGSRKERRRKFISATELDTKSGGAEWRDLRSAPSVHSDMAIRTLSTREVYRNPWLRLREDTIERSNGSSGIYSVIDKQDCAIILPIDGDHIWLVEQFRYTIGQRALELPQGGWEADNVDPEELARGELREETGLTAGRMTALPWMWIAYGFARQRQFIFVAEELVQGPHERDPEESDMEIVRLPIVAFEQKLRNGEIRDVCTLGAWAAYVLWRQSQTNGLAR
jgi:ADP-ribose pyrophosphatase